MQEMVAKVLSGAETAFVDADHKSDFNYRPSLLSNDYKKGMKVLSVIEDELRNCKSFIISVAFITQGGIVALLPLLKELEEKNIPGKILTTDYNIFTEPEALDKLAAFTNIEY